MKTLRELREKTLTPAEKKKREEIAKAIEKDNPDMPMDKKMAIATATAKRVAESLDEGRMKELHGYIERGMSAQQIARKMKLDVKTIKALMPKKESIDEVRQPLTVPKSLAKYVVYKKSGIGKIKQVAHLRAMPKGKELDRVLDKYDADGVIAMSKIQRNKMKVEAVEKPEIKEGKYKVNIKGEGGATVQARSEKEAIAKVMKQLGIANRFAKDRSFMKKISVLGESVEESRAYRDAMKGMKSRSATRGMATTKKDKDISATDDDRKAASKNIIMQLRKAADLPAGANVEFEKGKGKVNRATAQNVLAKFNRLQKPMDKEKFQKSIKSLADIKKILGR
jgi:hypothetical protein